MKVPVITSLQHKPHFKQIDKPVVLGYDDEISQTRRNYIREWQEKHYMPYQNIYKDGRKSEWEMEQMISDLVKKPVTVDNEKINQLRIPNLRPISEDPCLYRGAMVPVYKISKLYEAGIRRIITIGSAASDALKEACSKFEMDYQNIDFDSCSDEFKTINQAKADALNDAQYFFNMNENGTALYVDEYINTWKEKSRRGINAFTEYIQNMQKGNVFIGCLFGTYLTDTAIMMDYLFNPKMRHENGLNIYNKIMADCAEELYKNLTNADKIKMGWTKDFEQTFLKRLAELQKCAWSNVRI